MVYSGHVESGKVILDEDVALPDGTAVRVAVVRRDDAAPANATEPTLADKLAGYAGIVTGMPSDLAKNHDPVVVRGSVGVREGMTSEPPEEPSDKRTFLERYAKYVGIVEGMPSDLAKNHDHYLYGTPKE